ncbi:MAG: hypothetical protein IKH16_08355 [Selenomonadaceae bacterium]|nr:hypothetical protein [Selenomonadaceae bacterium]MBR4694819.1 hypothetical protein [Selenomonadaceae bacterium]
MSIKISRAADNVQIEFVYPGTGLNGILPSIFPPKRTVATFTMEAMRQKQKELCP